MAILFSNATILPMTADEGSPKTFTGFVGVAGSPTRGSSTARAGC